MRGLLAIGIVLAAAATAFGQSADPRVYLTARGGVSIERAEDNLKGTTAAGGVLIGRAWSDRWALEGEWWAAQAIVSDLSLHRDTLFGANLRRSFGAGAARPHILFGLTAMRTVDEFTTCAALRATPSSPAPTTGLVACDEPDVVERRSERFTAFSVVPLIGAGVAFDVSRRVVMVADVRVQPWITSFIVRPAIGVGVKF